MIALLWVVLAILASPFKSKSRLEAENPALRRQLIVVLLRGTQRCSCENDRSFPDCSHPANSESATRSLRIFNIGILAGARRRWPPPFNQETTVCEALAPTERVEPGSQKRKVIGPQETLFGRKERYVGQLASSAGG